MTAPRAGGPPHRGLALPSRDNQPLSGHPAKVKAGPPTWLRSSHQVEQGPILTQTLFYSYTTVSAAKKEAGDRSPAP